MQVSAPVTAAPALAPPRPPAAHAHAAEPDVVRAAARYAPSFGTLGVDDARRAQALVRDVVSQLPMRVHVNRGAEEALAFLRGDAQMPTAFDEHRPADAVWNAYMNERRSAEVAKGIHGDGPAAGRTVYGAVQLSDTLPTRTSGERRLNTGQVRYGEVSLIVRPEVLAARATFLPNDSFYTDARTGALTQLPDIILERVLRDFKVVAERSGESSPWPDVAARELHARFRQLLALPDSQARAALRAHLTSDSLTRNYVEAQLRGLRPSDIAEVRVELDPARSAPWRGSRDADIATRLLGDLTAAAQAHGIALHSSRRQALSVRDAA